LNFSQIFSQWIDRFLTPIDDPGSRLFHVNLLMSFMFIAWWVVLSTKKRGVLDIWHHTRRLVFRKRYWWNRSTKVDYQIYFFNSFLKILLFVPFLDFSYRFSQMTIKLLLPFNGRDTMNVPATTLNILLFTIAAFVFDDFLRFFHHVLMHKIPFLWKLHKTHHSARVLTPISLYRIHPLESAMATVRNSFSTGVSLGFFIFFFSGNFSLFTVFGVNFFGFAFNFLASNLRHSHIDLSFGPLERIFISPKQHQIHHSTRPEHFDRNFGVSLAIWDHLLGSLVRSKSVNYKLRFGLEGHHRQSLKKALTHLK